MTGGIISMRIRFLLPFAAAVCIAALCACTNTESEKSALEKAESYADTVDTGPI
jgi:curli biogenesis system outer membrane secretion channel CsgG